MESRKTVVLYNPSTGFTDMPLALLTVGSAASAAGYRVVIVDSRLEKNPEEVIRQLLPESVCFGITLITGPSVKDAIRMSETVKTIKPDLPVVWGGWHPSLFPVQVLNDVPEVDFVIRGQGETAFPALLNHLVQQTDFGGLPGLAFRRQGNIIANPAAELYKPGINGPPDYDLTDVEAWFRLKNKRQFDYVSSAGCSHRCAFCADPLLYQRKFAAKTAREMADEIQHYYERYRFTDLNFQDDTFFAPIQRVREFAEEIVHRGLNFTWAATMRADQGARMDNETWELCRKSGLRRVLIGVESGSPERLEMLRKDICIPQVMNCAERCRKYGIEANMPFITGFPGESESETRQSLKLMKKLNAMSPLIVTPVFAYRPYPGAPNGTEKTEAETPANTKEWAAFDFSSPCSGTQAGRKLKMLRSAGFYLRLAYGKLPLWSYPLRIPAKIRLAFDFYGADIEKRVADFFFKRKSF